MVKKRRLPGFATNDTDPGRASNPKRNVGHLPSMGRRTACRIQLAGLALDCDQNRQQSLNVLYILLHTQKAWNYNISFFVSDGGRREGLQLKNGKDGVVLRETLGIVRR